MKTISLDLVISLIKAKEAEAERKRQSAIDCSHSELAKRYAAKKEQCLELLSTIEFLAIK